MELRNTEKTDWWNEIFDTQRKSVELGISDADNGNLKPHEAKKIYEKWL